MTSASTPVRLPKYRRHKPSGQAVITLSGKDCYLGKHGTAASRRAYDRLIQEWLAAGRSLPASRDDAPLSVDELIVRYWRFAKGHYRKDGKPTGAVPGIKIALKLLRTGYGDTPAAMFGPLKLKTLRQKMVDAGQSRRYVNNTADRIRRVFRWGLAEELVPAAVVMNQRNLPSAAK